MANPGPQMMHLAAPDTPQLAPAGAGASARPRRLPGSSELRAQRQVVLPAVAVERTRLRRIQRVVLERRIIQVMAVEIHAEVIAEDPCQRCVEGPDVILAERRAAIESAVERRAEVVGD